MPKTNTRNKAGMTLHKWIATGGKPKEYNKANGTAAKRASSKQKGK